MIRVTFSFWTGREQSSHDCESVEAAYERMERTNMEAIAFKLGTYHGLYCWRPSATNTLEALRVAMEACE
jgi:fructose/tagatose bisphosphate aldolase